MSISGAMPEPLTNARTLLIKNGFSCVLVQGENVFASFASGVQPMLRFIDDGLPLAGCFAADRIVGKAAALLFLHVGVHGVYGETMSESAKALLELHGIPCFYGTLSPAIRNRAGDGPCPMEQATAHTEDPAEALAAIRKTLARLRQAQKKKEETMDVL